MIVLREVPLDEQRELGLEEGDRVYYRHSGATRPGTVIKEQRRVVQVEPDHQSGRTLYVPKKDIKPVAS